MVERGEKGRRKSRTEIEMERVSNKAVSTDQSTVFQTSAMT